MIGQNYVNDVVNECGKCGDDLVPASILHIVNSGRLVLSGSIDLDVERILRNLDEIVEIFVCDNLRRSL
jgi:hypothetical protein